MALKPGITLKLGQQLKMTPQLQQAIRLLQLSNIELQQEIQDALDSNLMLEESSPEDTIEEFNTAENAESTGSEEFADAVADETTDDGQETSLDPEIDGDAVPDSSEEMNTDTMKDDLPVDSVWEDVFDDSAPYQGSGGELSEDYISSLNPEEVTIKSHLNDQIGLLDLSDNDQIIAMAIVDSLDENGYLSEPIEDIHASLPMDLDIEQDEVLAVLHLIQHLDPVGIAAGDLSECLLVQLEMLDNATPWKQEAGLLINDYLDQLGSRDFAFLKRKLKLNDTDLKAVIDLVLTLNPRPGASIEPGKTEYIEPDVLVRKDQGRWIVSLNPGAVPKIRVNSDYARLVRKSDDNHQNSQLRDQLQEARWFLKSLQQRNDTLLKVSTKIVDYQRGFFDYGEQAMKPLVLHDVAEAVGLHESTVSRVTTQKYMHTPMGIFELKYFFSSHVSTHAGGEVSSTAIRALIKKLVTDEDPKKPLSDNKIANLLASQDIKVARRTIAKYRESLQIPPSNERKQLV